MREILFRGKRIDKGKWVYGYYVYTKDSNGEYQHFIVTPKRFIVDPSTVGMCVPGITDKNGKKIFEGDVIQNVNGYVFGDQYKAVVKMGDKNDGCYIGGYFGEGSLVDIDAYDFKKCEVIGNAIDNPELLEVRE